MGATFPFFQSREISPDCHYYTNIMKSGLVTTSANSFRTRIHLVWSYRLVFVQVPQVVPNLIISYGGGLCSPSPCALRSKHSRGLKREVTNEDWDKEVVEYLNHPLAYCYVTSLPVIFLTFFSWHTYRSSYYYSSHLLPSSALAVLWPSRRHLYTTEQKSYSLPRMSVPASTAFAFPSCSLVWSGCLYSATPVSFFPDFLHKIQNWI